MSCVDDATLRRLFEDLGEHRADRRPLREWLELPGLVATTRPSTSPWASTVCARLREDEVEGAIDHVLAFFRQRERGFVWHLTPRSAPADLGARLLAHGLIHEVDGRMLIAPLPVSGFRVNPEVRVVENDAGAVRAWLRGRGLATTDEEVEATLAERLEWLGHEPGRRGDATAFLDETAVGNARWRISDDGRCAMLIGATTVAARRNRGVYSTLNVTHCVTILTDGSTSVTHHGHDLPAP